MLPGIVAESDLSGALKSEYIFSMANGLPAKVFPPKLHDFFSRHSSRALSDLLQGIIDRARFRPALMALEIRLELLLGLVGVQQEFLPRPESQPAHVTVGDAGCGAYEPYDSQIPLGHASHDCRGGPCRQMRSAMADPDAFQERSH